MEYSFIEAVWEGAVPPATAADAILGGLLRMTPADVEAWHDAADPRARAMRRLRDECLDWGDDLALLDADVRATAERLRNRVIRVTRAGRIAWQAVS
jgi:hypothetical protein